MNSSAVWNIYIEGVNISGIVCSTLEKGTPEVRFSTCIISGLRVVRGYNTSAYNSMHECAKYAGNIFPRAGHIHVYSILSCRIMWSPTCTHTQLQTRLVTYTVYTVCSWEGNDCG